MMESSFIDDKGYIKLYMPEHPYANHGYVLAHRLAFEERLGRCLEPWEVVHHINEIKTDNSADNLYLTTGDEHVRIHNRNKTMSVERRSNISKGMREAKRNKRKGPA